MAACKKSDYRYAAAAAQPASARVSGRLHHAARPDLNGYPAVYRHHPAVVIDLHQFEAKKLPVRVDRIPDATTRRG